MPRTPAASIFTAVTAALLLSACATTQYTSGADYNARSLALNKASDVATSSAGVDADIARIAAVEPQLAFPARIGIAHIRHGQIAAVPTEHLTAWEPLSTRINARFGEVVPISPLIAGMVATQTVGRPSAANTIDNIRRGAARQHVDYVLVYEVSETSDSSRNALSSADWSILGLFMIPSRDLEVEAAASAMLIDVRNGYPYGTASGLATKDGIATSHGARSKQRRMSAKASDAAVEALAADVDTMFTQLLEEVALRRASVAN